MTWWQIWKKCYEPNQDWLGSSFDWLRKQWDLNSDWSEHTLRVKLSADTDEKTDLMQPVGIGYFQKYKNAILPSTPIVIDF